MAFLTLASSRSARLVTTLRSAKSISSRNAASWAAGSPPANPFKTISRASPSRIRARRWGLSACEPAIRPGVSRNSTVAGVTFLGLWSVGQEVQPRVGEGGDADLAGVDLAGVGTCSRQEFETTCSCRFPRTRRFRHASVILLVGSGHRTRHHGPA